MVELKLYYNTQQEPADNPANAGLFEAMELLSRLQNRGITCEKIDTAALPDETIYRAYADAWIPSVSKKFAIRRVFGTRRRSGCYFGREVPALLVYENDGEHPVDVYPREEFGRTVMLREFLEDLLADSC
ncbi:MAG: hypothetical protein ACE5LU_08930 [Anaerolineae bacterium]